MHQNTYRRFTYFVKTASESISKMLLEIKSEAIQKQLEQLEISAFNVYQKDDAHFIVIDASAFMNSAILNKALLSLEYFKNLEAELQMGNTNFSFKSSALERIYELDQKVVYTPEEGQLKTKIGRCKRFVWTLLLQEDTELMAEYKRVHSIGTAWPEITANMKSIGVKDMEIYLFNAQAILIMDTVPDFNLEDIGPKWQNLPRETEWQQYVSKYQRIDPKSSIQEKWLDMNAL